MISLKCFLLCKAHMCDHKKEEFSGRNQRIYKDEDVEINTFVMVTNWIIIFGFCLFE